MPDTFDVDLADEAGQSSFNPPSLRGVSQRSRFFHDGRARKLSEVFSRYRHPEGERIGARDLKDLLAFLNSL